MKNFLKDLFSAAEKQPSVSKEEVAAFLKTTPEALDTFEKAYHDITDDQVSDNLFEVNAKQAAAMHDSMPAISEETVENMINRIVEELKAETSVWSYDGKSVQEETLPAAVSVTPVTREEINALPAEIRPDLTGSFVRKTVDIPLYPELFRTLEELSKAKTKGKKEFLQNYFMQGLDTMDLDPIAYRMLDFNRNSMGYWLPLVVKDITADGFFKVPATKIVRVPFPVIQLTHCEYGQLSPTTLKIVDKLMYDVCKLDESKTYFIKTGTYSSKYDFRNAKVTGAKEVRELGEYLLYIHFAACQMANPTVKPHPFAGVSTTNEWVIRDFIEDEENNPTIYHGLPLHTEYRVFVDFDTKEILGIAPYWNPSVMKKHFDKAADTGNPDAMHDFVTYSVHEDTLMKRYEENKDTVLAHIQDFLNRNTSMSGQWSMDIMQNGDDFWFIDMADASHSALRDCVPAGKLHESEFSWAPKIEKDRD